VVGAGVGVVGVDDCNRLALALIQNVLVLLVVARVLRNRMGVLQIEIVGLLFLKYFV